MTWHYQDERGVRRTVSAYMERRTRSVPYLRWDNQLWTHRQIRAKHALAAHRLPLTNDWATAVRVVQRDWPGTADWLLSCSGGEGGHGIWVWNGGAPYDSPNHGSGVGGWMQYAPGTWSGQFSSALREAVQRHLALPLQKTSSWLSPIGQAFAAGWSRFHHATSAWDPGIDPACA